MKIGFIGLGHMGAGIAANLVRNVPPVAVWNRSPDKMASLVGLGATVASSPRSLAKDRDVVFTMLSDDAALQAVLEGDAGLFAGLPPGAVHVSLSTIAVATAEALTQRHAALGQGFVSAPVFGRPEAAAAAKLFIIAAGDPTALLRVKPLFPFISQRVFELGTTPSRANLVKLCGNFMILAAIESLAEAMTLAQHGGVDKAKLLEILTATLFDAPVYRNYGAILVEERFRPAGFAAPLGLKDMRLVGAAAKTHEVDMPFRQVLETQLLTTIATQGADIDWSGIATALKP